MHVRVTDANGKIIIQEMSHFWLLQSFTFDLFQCSNGGINHIIMAHYIIDFGGQGLYCALKIMPK